MQPLPATILENLVEQRVLKKKFAGDLKFSSSEIVNWADRDFLAIMDRHRSKGVLIADLNIHFTVPFRLQARKASSMTGRVEAIICDFCSTWQRGSNSAVITFDRSDKSSRSYLCCADLLCSLHVRDLTAQAKISRTQLREHTTPVRRIERLKANLERIISEL